MKIFVENASTMEAYINVRGKNMSTGLQIKVISLLCYVAVSTALVLLLAEDGLQGAAQTLFAVAPLP